MLQPGDCSPSLSVVSKIRILFEVLPLDGFFGIAVAPLAMGSMLLRNFYVFVNVRLERNAGYSCVMGRLRARRVNALVS
jgi:formate hydrogenlyase subunit 3/multisubunit Na+/H+ antiporter MnhD subunit